MSFKSSGPARISHRTARAKRVNLSSVRGRFVNLVVGALVGGAASMFAGVAFAADTINPGLYKITVTMDSPQGSQTRTSESCLTEEDVTRGPNPMADQAGDECKLVRYDLGGGKLSMEMRCSGGPSGESVILGEGEYDDDSFNMVNKMTVKVPNLDVEMNMTTTSVGERIGECK